MHVMRKKAMLWITVTALFSGRVTKAVENATEVLDW